MRPILMKKVLFFLALPVLVGFAVFTDSGQEFRSQASLEDEIEVLVARNVKRVRSPAYVPSSYQVSPVVAH
jgi:hypothetical protein